MTAPGAGVPQSPAQTREAAVTPDGVRLPPAAAAWTLVFRGTSVRGSHTVTVTDPPASPSPPRSLGPVARPQCTPGARPRSSLSDLPRLGTGAPNCPPLPSCSGVGSTQPPSHPYSSTLCVLSQLGENVKQVGGPGEPSPPLRGPWPGPGVSPPALTPCFRQARGSSSVPRGPASRTSRRRVVPGPRGGAVPETRDSTRRCYRSVKIGDVGGLYIMYFFNHKTF